MTECETGNWVRNLIEANNLHEFYTNSLWLRLRAEVLAEDKYECQDCKARGYYTKADTVHHTKFLRKYPELALTKIIVIDGKEYKILISLCHDCHEKAHGYRQKMKRKPLTEERW